MTTVPVPFSGVPRVNLMPRSEIARRERDKLVRLWVWLALGAILVALLIVAGAFALKFLADQRLAAENARTQALIDEISSLSEVSQALASESELTLFREQAAAIDLAWAPVIAKVTGTLPGEANLIGFDTTVGGVPVGQDPNVETGLTGTVSIDSPRALDIVPIIRALRGVDGVLFADGQSITSERVEEGRFAYLLNVTFDQSVYSGAYAEAEEGEN